MSMRIRLLTFLIALVAMMILGIATILLMTGTVTSGEDEAETLIRKELNYLNHNLSVLCGDASVQLVLLSKSLAGSIESQLSGRDIQVSDLKKHPEVLEDVIEGELSRLLIALEKTKCSGVFMVLDATVNPSLENAEHSKAGLYIRNGEPSIAGPGMTRLYLRGSSDIATKYNLTLQAKWDMEFDVKGRSFYNLPIEKYNETKLPLSRLYYWSFEGAISNLGEDVLICSIPLIDSDGEAFGVCGFEISDMNFNLNYTPDNSEYDHILCMFSTKDDYKLEPDGALLSGNRTGYWIKQDSGPLYYTNRGGLFTYTPENGKELVGLHTAVKMYPDDSAFHDRQFALSLLIPKENFDAAISQTSMKIGIIFAVLLFLGVVASVFMSKKYIAPIMAALNSIQTDTMDGSAKTNILEVDLLVEKIIALRAKENPLPDDLFADFITRVRGLTPTEMSIFRHYLEGKSGNDILAVMFISANTLRVHNRHIYSKLGVSSKDELMLYIELLKKSGMLSEIS